MGNGGQGQTGQFLEWLDVKFTLPPKTVKERRRILVLKEWGHICCLECSSAGKTEGRRLEDGKNCKGGGN